MVTKNVAAQKVIADFVRAKCEFGEGRFVRASALYLAFKEWMRASSLMQQAFQFPSRRVVTTIVKNLYPITTDKANDGLWLLGICVVPSVLHIIPSVPQPAPAFTIPVLGKAAPFPPWWLPWKSEHADMAAVIEDMLGKWKASFRIVYPRWNDAMNGRKTTRINGKQAPITEEDRKHIEDLVTVAEYPHSKKDIEAYLELTNKKYTSVECLIGSVDAPADLDNKKWVVDFDDPATKDELNVLLGFRIEKEITRCLIIVSGPSCQTKYLHLIPGVRHYDPHREDE